MAIEYALYKNNIKKDTDQYTARVLKTSSADFDTVVDRIVSQDSYMPRPVIIAVLSTFIAVVERLLLDGIKVKINGLLEMAPKIQGKFSSPADRYDPLRHKLNIAANALGKTKKHIRENAELTKVETFLPHPVLCWFLDNATGKENATITPNSLGILNGCKLSFDPNEKEEGIFLIDTATGRETKITNLAENKPSQLIFQVPDFEYNSVYIEVRKRFTRNGTLRNNRLPNILFNTATQIKIIPTKQTNNRSLISNQKAATKNTFQNYTITTNPHQSTFTSTEKTQNIAL